jgi:hypothetical protein
MENKIYFFNLDIEKHFEFVYKNLYIFPEEKYINITFDLKSEYIRLTELIKSEFIKVICKDTNMSVFYFCKIITIRNNFFIDDNGKKIFVVSFSYKKKYIQEPLKKVYNETVKIKRLFKVIKI